MIQRESYGMVLSHCNPVGPSDVVVLCNLKRITSRVRQICAFHRIADREVLHIAVIIRFSVKLQLDLKEPLFRVRINNIILWSFGLKNAVCSGVFAVKRNERLIIHVFLGSDFFFFINAGTGNYFPCTVYVMQNVKLCTGQSVSHVLIKFVEFHQSVEVTVGYIDNDGAGGFHGNREPCLAFLKRNHRVPNFHSGQDKVGSIRERFICNVHNFLEIIGLSNCKICVAVTFPEVDRIRLGCLCDCGRGNRFSIGFHIIHIQRHGPVSNFAGRQIARVHCFLRLNQRSLRVLCCNLHIVPIRTGKGSAHSNVVNHYFVRRNGHIDRQTTGCNSGVENNIVFRCNQPAIARRRT